MISDFLLLLGGLALLAAGAEYLVKGSVSLANRLRVPPLLIGLTVVGFGTSMPELMVSLKAALDGAPAIAIGNVVGSNTANILLIIGAAALISPIKAEIPNLGRDLMMMLMAAIVMLGLGYLGVIARLTGFIALIMLVGYLIRVTVTDRANHRLVEAELTIKLPIWMEVICVLGGLAALILGARFLIGSATGMARTFGISEAVIGLTIVAVGTSLPELATSLVAAFRRQSEIAIGNVVGSNIFNVLGILGITALIKPVPIDRSMAGFDIPFMAAVSLAFAVVILRFKYLSRPVGALMIAMYTGYVAWLF